MPNYDTYEEVAKLAETDPEVTEVWHPDYENFNALLITTESFSTRARKAGNLAAASAQRYVNSAAHKEVPLTGLLLVVPYLLEPALVPEKYRPLYFSREQNADALIVDRKAMDFVQRQAQIDIASPLFSPFAAERPHVSMPPAYIQLAGQDPLRDDALVYERALRDHGVKTRLDVYPGVPHGHLYMIPGLQSATKAHQDLIKGAGWLLGKQITDEDAAKALTTAAAAVPPPSLPRVN